MSPWTKQRDARRPQNCPRDLKERSATLPSPPSQPRTHGASFVRCRFCSVLAGAGSGLLSTGFPLGRVALSTSPAALRVQCPAPPAPGG